MPNRAAGWPNARYIGFADRTRSELPPATYALLSSQPAGHAPSEAHQAALCPLRDQAILACPDNKLNDSNTLTTEIVAADCARVNCLPDSSAYQDMPSAHLHVPDARYRSDLRSAVAGSQPNPTGDLRWPLAVDSWPAYARLCGGRFGRPPTHSSYTTTRHVTFTQAGSGIVDVEIGQIPVSSLVSGNLARAETGSERNTSITSPDLSPGY